MGSTNLYNFTTCKFSDKEYGGNAGLKQGIIFNNEPWFLKFPKSTRDNRTREISYTTSPLSEYLGSNIYSIIGLPVHETLLGEFNNKIVVACKDFVPDNSRELLEYTKIKNRYFENFEELIEEREGSGSSDDLNEIKVILEHNPILKETEGIKEHFWDMFVVDALIGNLDRNNDNWGVIKNSEGNYRIAPVYDNGNAFTNKAGDEKMLKQLLDSEKLLHSNLNTTVCFFTLNGKKINPYKYILDCNDPDLCAAIKRITPKIDTEKIYEFIDSVPNSYNGLLIISDIRRAYYKRMIEVKYNEVILPTYNKLVEQEKLLNSKTVECDKAVSEHRLEASSVQNSWSESLANMINDASTRQAKQELHHKKGKNDLEI